MNNTKKGDSGAKLIFGNEEWDEKPFFLISLIEHKSRVDYNVIMQLLRYMVFIWIDYEREIKKQTGNKDIARSKNFRYPPILPIVYYEDSGRWTADMHFAARIMLNDVFKPFIPQFTYKLIQLNSYTKSELIEKQDELSLVMLINKLQDASEFKDLDLPEDYLKDLSANTPDEVLEIISKVITVMLRKLNLEENEILDFTDQVRERKMGELFENFRGYDVPAVRRESEAKGYDLRLIEQVGIKFEKGQSADRIADDLVENVDTINKIRAAIEKTGTHDAATIYQFMNPKQESSAKDRL